ncbi:MAG TPA: NAD(P)H-quinone oxidoreductase [Actinoplanes sp.]
MSELQAERLTPAEQPAPPRRTDPLGWLFGRLREPYVQLLATQLLAGGVAFVANVMMARALSPTGRGEVALMLQIAYLAAQGLLLGTERSFTAECQGVTPAAAVRAYARILVIPCSIGLALAIAFAALAPDGLNPGVGLTGLVFCYVVVEVAMLATQAIAVVADRMSDFLRCRVVESVLTLGVMALLYGAHVAHPGAWIGAYLIAGTLPMVAYVVRWLRAPATPAITVAQRRLIRREGLTLFPAAVANMGMLRVDRLALPALSSTAALGLYASVATMTELLAWPLRAFADSRLGHWRAKHRGGGLRARPLILAATVYAVVVAPLLAGGLYLLIVPVLGEQYAPARVVVVPLVAAAGMYAVSRVSLGLLVARGHGTLVSAAEICGFAVSLVAYLTLIPRYGISGAAYGSLLGYGACLLFAVLAGRLAGRRAADPVEAGQAP